MGKILNWDQFGINESAKPSKWVINNVKDVENFILDLAKQGKIYHFDDAPGDIVDINGKDLFGFDEAADVETAMQKSFDVCEKTFGKDGFWEGMIKDVFLGYIAFGADVEPATGDVYIVKGSGGKDNVKTVSLANYQEMKSNPEFYHTTPGGMSELNNFDEAKLDKWFNGLKNA